MDAVLRDPQHYVAAWAKHADKTAHMFRHLTLTHRKAYMQKARAMPAPFVIRKSGR
jgi:hypothetical protein